MKKKIFLTILLSIAILILSAVAVYAYEIDPSYRPINQPFGNQTYSGRASDSTIVVLQVISGALLYLAAPVAVIILVMAGFNLVMGGAESEQLDTAKKQITWALIGLALIILSYSIVRAILDTAIQAAEMGTPSEITDTPTDTDTLPPAVPSDQPTPDEGGSPTPM